MTLINTSDRYHDRSYLSKNNWLAKMKKKYSDCTGVGVHGLQCNDNCKIKNNVNVYRGVRTSRYLEGWTWQGISLFQWK